MTSRTCAQALAMIEALRSRLGTVPLEIGALCRIGTADAALLRRTLAPAADPAGLLAWAGWQQVHEHAQILVRPAPVAAYRPGPACYDAAAAYPQAECRWAFLASPVNARAAAPSLAPARSPIPQPDPRRTK